MPEPPITDVVGDPTRFRPPPRWSEQSWEYGRDDGPFRVELMAFDDYNRPVTAAIMEWGRTDHRPPYHVVHA